MLLYLTSCSYYKTNSNNITFIIYYSLSYCWLLLLRELRCENMNTVFRKLHSLVCWSVNKAKNKLIRHDRNAKLFIAIKNILCWLLLTSDGSFFKLKKYLKFSH